MNKNFIFFFPPEENKLLFSHENLSDVLQIRLGFAAGRKNKNFMRSASPLWVEAKRRTRGEKREHGKRKGSCGDPELPSMEQSICF